MNHAVFFYYLLGCKHFLLRIYLTWSTNMQNILYVYTKFISSIDLKYNPAFHIFFNI